MRSILLLFCIFVLGAANPSQGQEPETADSLLIGVALVTVSVDSLSPGLVNEGITASVLCDTILFSLKAAGIEVAACDSAVAEAEIPALVLHVEAVIEAGIDQVCYALRLELAQTVRLLRDDTILARRVPTWSEGSIGLHRRRWQDELIKDVLRHTESFIEAYLAANPGNKEG